LGLAIDVAFAPSVASAALSDINRVVASKIARTNNRRAFIP
jgi:hypothetical protein